MLPSSCADSLIDKPELRCKLLSSVDILKIKIVSSAQIMYNIYTDMHFYLVEFNIYYTHHLKLIKTLYTVTYGHFIFNVTYP